MVNLKTKYMGLELKNPIIVGACGLSKELDNVKKMEGAGAAAIVLPSLFEEEISYDQKSLDHFLGFSEGSSFEAMDYFAKVPEFKNYKGEEYLESLAKIKKAVHIPVIGSLNGNTLGGWVNYAKKMQSAGANAIELNLYDVPTDVNVSALDIENRYLSIIAAVKKEVTIPVAVKLSPFFSNIANFAVRVDKTGADGLVLFNRFLEPDYDLDHLEPYMRLDYSTNAEMRLPLHWTAILHGKVKGSISATRGVKEAIHVIKLVMAGADSVQVASLLYQAGIGKIEVLLRDMQKWMTEHDYGSIEQMKGSMSYKKVQDPTAFERANYMKMLRSIR